MSPVEPVELCNFENRLMSETVTDAFRKLGVSTLGFFADLPGPGPVTLVRMVRDPAGGFPRAAVFLSCAGINGTIVRSLVVCTYRDGRVDKQVVRMFAEDEWQRGEPEAMPLALRRPLGRR